MVIKDIANALNISPSTVSKAINNATDVSESTKTTILNYIESVGYKIKPRTANKKNICVFFEDVDFNSSSQLGFGILSSFKQEALKHKYNVVVESVSNGDNINYDAEMKKNNYIGGFVIGSNLQSKLLQSLENTTYPTILLDNYVKNENTAYIGTDNNYSMTQLVKHLVGLGHKNIAMLSGEKESIVTKERVSSFIYALLDNDIKFDQSSIYYGSYSEDAYLDYIDTIIRSDVSAVVCGCDLIAIGLIKALQKRGIDVPNDISIVGIDDIDLSRYISPALTTIRQDTDMIGSTAFSLLRQLIKGFRQNKVLIGSELMIRKSTK